MSQEKKLSESELCAFGEELITIWRTKKDDSEYYKKFSTFSKAELHIIINYFIEETEEIKGINKLIRLKESLNTIFDLKLLYNNLKLTLLSNY